MEIIVRVILFFLGLISVVGWNCHRSSLLQHGGLIRKRFRTVTTIAMTKSQISDLPDSKYLNKEKPVFVAGGRNGVGYDVIRQLSARGTPVHTLVHRMESLYKLEDLPGVRVMHGDAMNPQDVQKCMEGCVAAVTALSGAAPPGGCERVDYAGNSNVIEQAGILGVERIILVTSLGCGQTKEAISPSLYGDLRESLMAKDRAERDLKLYTNLDWTIIRPGGLKNDEIPTGEAILTEDCQAGGCVRRIDVAQLILKVLGSKFGAHKELSAIDPTLSKNKDDEHKYIPYEIY